MSGKETNMIKSIIAIGAAVAAGTAYLYSKGKRAIAQKDRLISFDDFLKEISDYADHYMIKEEKKTGFHYYGGECEIAISASDPQIIEVNIKLYCQDASKKWQTSTITHRRAIQSFINDPDTQGAIKKLSESAMKCKITPPETKSKEV